METIYANPPTAREKVMSETSQGCKAERVSFDKGIEMWIEGASFAHKGFPTPEALQGINLVKRITVEGLKMLLLPVFWPVAALFLVLPKRRVLGPILKAYNRIGWTAIENHIIKSDYRMDVTKEVKSMIWVFLYKLGVDPVVADTTSLIVSHLIEYDAAYRYRFEDLMRETNKERLVRNPGREIKRLLKLNQEREISSWPADRVRWVGKAITMLLWSPVMHRAFKEVMQVVNFEKLKGDQADWYWMCIRKDYYYGGMSHEKREKWITDHGFTSPTTVPLPKE